MFEKTMGNVFQNDGQPMGKPRATCSIFIGNVFQNHGQCFLKLSAMIYEIMGNISAKKNQIIDQNKRLLVLLFRKEFVYL